MKYDLNGNKQWTKLIGTDGGDCGNGIAVDSNNNFYIVSNTTPLQTFETIDSYVLLAKYDSSGNEQWSSILDISDGNDFGSDIAIDAFNNIFVSGTTEFDIDGEPYIKNNDVFIVKYDTNGTEQWKKTFGTKESEFS